MLRLGHNKLNIDGHYNQICQCGAIKTEIHMFLECPSTCASRRMLFTNVSKILAEENVFSHSELLHRIELNWSTYFSSDTLNCLKVRHCACLGRRVCFCPDIRPFNMTSPFDTFLFVLFYLCVCVSFFFCVSLCGCQWCLQALACLHWLFVNK